MKSESSQPQPLCHLLPGSPLSPVSQHVPQCPEAAPGHPFSRGLPDCRYSLSLGLLLRPPLRSRSKSLPGFYSCRPCPRPLSTHSWARRRRLPPSSMLPWPPSGGCPVLTVTPASQRPLLWSCIFPLQPPRLRPLLQKGLPVLAPLPSLSSQSSLARLLTASLYTGT